MKLGFLTAPFPDTPLMEVADWAAATGFEVLEIACWPKADRARRGATPARATSTSRTCRQPRRRDIRAEIAAKGLAISGLGFYPNPLHPDPEHRGAGHRPSQAASSRRAGRWTSRS